MANDDVQRFNSIFDIIDRATGPLAQITRGMQGLQVATSKATALISPLNTALGLIGAGLSFDKILDIGSKFENTTLKMAQTAKLMGMGGETFAEATTVANQMIQQVNAAAAALPGEAEDYQTALEMAGFTVQQATGDYQKTFGLIKDITAITIANQRSSAEAANQLNKMLNADRGLLELQNDYSMKLIQNMRAIPGYANLTVTAFNNLKLEERVKLTQQLAGTYKDMLDASANTLDAIKGAAMTTFKEVTRQATEPIFDGWKNALKAINSLFMQADGTLTLMSQKVIHIGNVLSRDIVDGLTMLAQGAVGPGAIGAGAGALASVAGGSMPGLIVLGATLGELSTRTEFLSTVFSQLSQTAGIISGLFAPLGTALQVLSVNLADMVSGVLPGVLDGLNKILDPIVEFGGAIIGIVAEIYQRLQPAFQVLWGSVSALFSGIGNFVMPILKFLGIGLYTLYDIVSEDVVPIFSKLINAISSVIKWIADKLTFLGAQLTWGLEQLGVQGGMSDRSLRATQAMEKLLGAFKLPDGGAPKAPTAPKPPDKRAVTGMVQDFRYSRFEISQKFEEGYDPDRIAVSFANDLGKIGEQRSQSGFAPLFSVGI